MNRYHIKARLRITDANGQHLFFKLEKVVHAAESEGALSAALVETLKENKIDDYNGAAWIDLELSQLPGEQLTLDL